MEVTRSVRTSGIRPGFHVAATTREWLTRDGRVRSLGRGVSLLVYLLVLWLLAAPEQRTILGDLGYLPVMIAATIMAWHASNKKGLDRRSRLAWRFLALAPLDYFVAMLVWGWYELVLHEAPFPSWADLPFLLFYPFILAGILLFPTPRRSGLDRATMVLDMSIVLLGGGMALWYYTLRPIAMANYSSLLENVLAVAYPLGDLVMLVAVASLLLGKGRNKNLVWARVLAIGLILFFVADTIFAYLNLQDDYQSGGWTDALWAVAFYLMLLSPQIFWLKPQDAQDAQDSSVISAYTARAAKGATRTAHPLTLLPYVALAIGYGLLLALAVLNWEAPLSDLIVFSIALTGLVVLRQNITTRENIRLVALHAEVQGSLLSQLMHTQEAERRRLSIEVHDGPLQSLGVSLMAVDRAARRYERGEHELVLKELAFLRRSLGDITGEVRAILKDLSLDVLNTYGLKAAMQNHVQQFSEVTGIVVEVDNAVDRRLSGDAELLIYRLMQESLANVRKHTEAAHVWLTLKQRDSRIVLTIRDDGRGFDVQGALSEHEDGQRIGLRSMRQRVQAAGGDLTIVSEPGNGATLQFWCPLARRRTNDERRTTNDERRTTPDPWPLTPDP